MTRITATGSQQRPYQRFLRQAGRLLVTTFCLVTADSNAFGLGQSQYVEVTDHPGNVVLVENRRASPIFVDLADYAGVARAANDLKADIAKVTGCGPEIVHDARELKSSVILIGTLGKSSLLDQLIHEGKLNVTAIAGKWSPSPSRRCQILCQTLRVRW